MVLFTLMGRILGLTSTIILARLLEPTDFGLVAMAMSIVYALELLNSFGFEFVLIHLRDAGKAQYNTAWTIRLIFAFLVAALLVVLAGPAADFYEQPDLPAIIYCLAFAVAVEGFQNIGIVGFLKELQFRKEFKWRIIVKLVMFVTTVPLAFYLQNYWALIVGMIVGRITGVVLSYVMHPYRPSPSLASWRQLLGFSSWLALNNIIGFFNLRSADFIVGRMAGAAQLGLFSVANELANLITTDLVMPINRAVFPGFAKVSHDLDRLRREYLNVIGFTCLIAFPACLGISSTAELLIPIMLGDKWLATIPLIQVLAIQALYGSFHINSASVYIALGRPRIATFIGLCYVVTLLPLLFFWTRESGATGAAYAYLATVCVITPIGFAVTLNVLRLSVRAFVSTFWRPLVAATAMYVLVGRTIEYVGPGTTFLASLGNLLTSVAAGAVSYLILVVVLWLLSSRPPGAEMEVLKIIRRRLETRTSDEPQPDD